MWTRTLDENADWQLMARLETGDPSAFEELLGRHRRRVIRWLYRLVRNYAVAEELAQEVFLRVYRSRENYQPAARFTTWLYRIATNRALNWLRDHKDEAISEDLELLPISGGIPRQVRDPRQHAGEMMLEQSEADEFRGRIRRAVDALPARQRSAVLLHKFEELNYVEVAEVMGTSVPTVKSLLWRAYTQLRRDLLPLAEGRDMAVTAPKARAPRAWMPANGIGSLAG